MEGHVATFFLEPLVRALSAYGTDPVACFDWLSTDDVERIAQDPRTAAEVRNRIRLMQEQHHVLVLPGHDLRQLGPPRPDIVRHHPERFSATFWLRSHP